MNRRNAIKAAIAGVAAAVGWKVKKIHLHCTVRSDRITWEDIHGNPITNSRGEPISVSVEDARFIESGTFSVEEVKRWYRIPDGVL
jgi:hypothetical protein